MNLDLYIELISFLSFFLFIITNLISIEKNSTINKLVYLSSVLFLSVINFLYYYFVSSNPSSVLLLVTSLLIVIIFFTHFFASFYSHEFIRLRILFIPFFFILILFRFFNTLDSDELKISSNFFDNKLLLIHIFSSLFSYSMLSISAVSSICVFFKSRLLKKITYNGSFLSILPSIHESEIIAIKFLLFTVFFLTISLVTGFFYHIGQYENLSFFINKKNILSIITLFLIIFFMIYRHYKGLSVFETLKVILVSYLFIKLAYFGLKVIG